MVLHQHHQPARAHAPPPMMGMPSKGSFHANAISRQLQDMETVAKTVPKGVTATNAGVAGGVAGRSSPVRSNSAGSGLFDALVMAATGNVTADGIAAVGQQAPHHDPFAVMSRLAAPALGGAPNAAFAPVRPGGSAMPQAGAGPGAIPQRMHAPPQKNRSRLWSALSSGELDSLQVGKENTYVEAMCGYNRALHWKKQLAGWYVCYTGSFQ